MSFFMKGADAAENHTVRRYMDVAWPNTVKMYHSNSSVTSVTQAIPTVAARVYDDIISSPAVRVSIIVCYLVVILVATLGNMLVILVIYRRRSLRRNPAVLLILNLALCDLTSCLVYRPLLLVELFLPFVSMQIFDHNQLDECKVASYFQGMLAGVGFHTMVVISLERLALIVFPLRAKIICTYTRTLKILTLIWCMSAVVYLPVPFLYVEIRAFQIDGTTLRMCGYFSGSISAITYFSFIFGFYFLIPLIVITAAYSKIFQTLYRRMEHMDLTTSTAGSKSLHTRRKLAKMMLAVAVIFALCWGPNFVLYLWVACGLGIKRNGFFAATIVEFLPIISSALNPFIYTLNSRTFQSGLKRILCARFCRPRLEESSLYRSFNSLHYPSTGVALSPHTVHRNLRCANADLNSQHPYTNSTFSPHMAPRYKSYSSASRQNNRSEMRSPTKNSAHRKGLSNGAAAKKRNNYYAHARRNTFVMSDWTLNDVERQAASRRARPVSHYVSDWCLSQNDTSAFRSAGAHSLERIPTCRSAMSGEH